MIAQISGILLSKNSTEAVIDCSGIAYRINISLNSHEKLPAAGNKCRLFTHMTVREDDISLWGFAEKSEREAFLLLISVPKIGAKTAIGILSSVRPADFANYIMENNLAALTRLPGIGKKSAEKIVLELKDKIVSFGRDKESLSTKSGMIREEALQALITLGYSASLANKSIRKAIENDPELENSAELLIKSALKYAMS